MAQHACGQPRHMLSHLYDAALNLQRLRCSIARLGVRRHLGLCRKRACTPAIVSTPQHGFTAHSHVEQAAPYLVSCTTRCHQVWPPLEPLAADAGRHPAVLRQTQPRHRCSNFGVPQPH